MFPVPFLIQFSLLSSVSHLLVTPIRVALKNLIPVQYQVNCMEFLNPQHRCSSKKQIGERIRSIYTYWPILALSFQSYRNVVKREGGRGGGEWNGVGIDFKSRYQESIVHTF